LTISASPARISSLLAIDGSFSCYCRQGLPETVQTAGAGCVGRS
jgi:hypothetical protein